MNIPNILTVFRIVLTFVFLLYIGKVGFEAKLIAFVLFIVASITDFFDGFIARKYNLISDFGKLMDPIADKFLMLSAFFMFAKLNMIAWWMFVVIAAREVLITLFRFWAKKKGATLAAENWGKYKTVAQIVSAGFILLYMLLLESEISTSWMADIFQTWDKCIYAMMLVSVTLTLMSGVTYLWNNRKHLHVG